MRLVKGPKLKMSQKVEKVQVSDENQKVQNSKFGLFVKKGVENPDFQVFPKVNVDFELGLFLAIRDGAILFTTI